MSKLLTDLQEITAKPNTGNSSGVLDRAAVEIKIGEFQAVVGECNELMKLSVDQLKKQGSSVGESYHWIVFALLYGGLYLVAST